MRVLIQRVSSAGVAVEGKPVAAIAAGLVLLIGIRSSDDEAAVAFCADKCAHLRIFADDEGRLNLSALDTGAEVLAVSQFTLYGDCRKGRRPSFSHAAPPEIAAPLYELFIERLEGCGLRVARGVFGAHMQVEINNDGPVTLLVEYPETGGEAT